MSEPQSRHRNSAVPWQSTHSCPSGIALHSVATVRNLSRSCSHPLTSALLCSSWCVGSKRSSTETGAIHVALLATESCSNNTELAQSCSLDATGSASVSVNNRFSFRVHWVFGQFEGWQFHSAMKRHSYYRTLYPTQWNSAPWMHGQGSVLIPLCIWRNVPEPGGCL